MELPDKIRRAIYKEFEEVMVKLARKIRRGNNYTRKDTPTTLTEQGINLPVQNYYRSRNTRLEHRAVVLPAFSQRCLLALCMVLHRMEYPAAMVNNIARKVGAYLPRRIQYDVVHNGERTEAVLIYNIELSTDDTGSDWGSDWATSIDRYQIVFTKDEVIIMPNRAAWVYPKDACVVNVNAFY